MAIYNKTKLYFYKLPNTFFYRDEIEWLKQNRGIGHITVLIYLELISETINKEGYLARKIKDRLIPYSVDEIALLIKEDSQDVKEALNQLIDIGLIEIKETEENGNNIYFIEEALEVTNQTEGAKRKKEQRDKRKDIEVDKCPPNCPPDIDKEKESDNRDKNIDIRNKNTEIKIDLENKNYDLDVYCAFEDYIEKGFERTLSINEVELLKEIITKYNQIDIKLAVDRAIKNDKTSIGYVKGILEHMENGFDYYDA